MCEYNIVMGCKTEHLQDIDIWTLFNIKLHAF